LAVARPTVTKSVGVRPIVPREIDERLRLVDRGIATRVVPQPEIERDFRDTRHSSWTSLVRRAVAESALRGSADELDERCGLKKSDAVFN
jgi:hypothetical protein